MRLTREVRWSLSPGRGSEEGNSWAGWPPPAPTAAFVCVRVRISGTPDPHTGYLCDIRELDAVVRRAAARLDHQRLPRDWESLAVFLWRESALSMPRAVALDRIEVLASPFLCYAVNRETPDMVQTTEQFEFSASHRLHCPELSDEENRRIFGKCNNPSGHGHNYILEVTIVQPAGDKDSDRLPLDRFEEIVSQRVLRRFDHKHLNIDVEEFRDRNPTVENIAKVIWDLLDGALSPARLKNIRVYETPKTWADYDGSSGLASEHV